MRYEFIEIGTSDFDTEIQKCSDETIGLSIEPIDYYLKNLPNKKNVKKINSAVSNYNGTTEVFYLSEETISKFNLPDYVKGQNSIGAPHPEILAWSSIGLRVEDISKKITSVINFKKIVTDYNVDSIGLLKIDTEGHDCIIMEDYLNYVNDKPNLFADKIIFESNILNNQNTIKNIIQRCISIGYQLISSGENTILIKN